MQEESEFGKQCGDCEYRLYPLTSDDCPVVGPIEGWREISKDLPLPFCCPKHDNVGSVTMDDIKRLDPPPLGTWMRDCMPYFRRTLFKKMKGA